MEENRQDDLSQNTDSDENVTDAAESVDALKKSLSEVNDKYIRLYAEFENYKKISARTKEDQLKYANENLIKDLLTVIDHLELALQHAATDETSNSLAEGVELTLKEMKTVLEKYGVASIQAIGKPFDPVVHHAMAQIESDETEDNIVVKEFRKGYMFKERVLRAALVGVSKKPSANSGEKEQSAVTNKN